MIKIHKFAITNWKRLTIKNECKVNKLENYDSRLDFDKSQNKIKKYK